jgi:hypothetical protein
MDPLPSLLTHLAKINAEAPMLASMVWRNVSIFFLMPFEALNEW